MTKCQKVRPKLGTNWVKMKVDGNCQFPFLCLQTMQVINSIKYLSLIIDSSQFMERKGLTVADVTVTRMQFTAK